MQVKIKQETQVFKPVTLEIIFETAGEMLMLQEVMLLDISIPELVYKGDICSQRVLMGMMQSIIEAINSTKLGD